MYRSTIEQIARKASRPKITFTTFDLSRLLETSLVGIAPQAADYFANCLPEFSINLQTCRILSGRDIYSQNKSAIPCCYTVAHGFIAIATDIGRNSFALDITDAKVYVLSHDKYESDQIEPGWNEDRTDFLPAIPITRESIIDTCEDLWDSLDEFLSDCLHNIE